MQGDIEGGWCYQQVELGFNYRMTDIQAALGHSQMQRLEQYIKTRHEIREKYDQLLSDLPLVLPWQSSDCYSALHLYPVQIKDECNVSRTQVFNLMREKGIGVNVHYIPVHTQPFYQNLGFKKNDFINSIEYYQRTISLPLFSTMSEQQQLEVVSALKSSLS